jgi:coenzyme Q-binding protein COQ10
MPQYSTRRRVRHPASQMFDLVSDVERYPEFVPLCRAMRVLRRTNVNGREVVIAKMEVAYKLIWESFTSRVTLDRERRDIQVEYLDGPFSRMENRWRFHPIVDAGQRVGSQVDVSSGVVPERANEEGAACDVEFFIAYEFKSRALSMLMGTMFDVAFRRFASAFEHRADVVFGKAT